MIRTSWSTFRDRWQLFVGAISATAIGVALVQASLLTLLSAVHPHVPPGISWNEELVIREGYAGAVSLAAIMMAISTFVAVFVVSSTFAFTVAQRRRDFALLRLIGAQPRDVRRLVRGEAVTLGALGAGLGVPLGRIVAEVQRSTFVRLDLVPADHQVGWHWWIVAVGIGVGILVATIGAGAASRRAARARPLDALSSEGIDDAVMSWLRWLLGVLAGLGTVALIVAAPLTGSAAGIDTSIAACLVSVVALTALAPAAIPRFAAAIQRPDHRGHRDRPLSELVHANLRDGIRRSASTAEV
jgi:putative ABC transport system permease protein